VGVPENRVVGSNTKDLGNRPEPVKTEEGTRTVLAKALENVILFVLVN
jgi:hypothetical protein